MSLVTDGSFKRMDLSQAELRRDLVDIGGEYFRWMNDEIAQRCGFSIPDIVGMSIDAYVLHTTDIAARIAPADGGVYCQRDADGRIMAIGGLRRLPDDTAEIVRIFTRPAFRGQGLGFGTVSHLVAEARRLGYAVVPLDTAVFMTSAQKIYRDAGFQLRDPYSGAEPPERLLPFWLFMERPL